MGLQDKSGNANPEFKILWLKGSDKLIHKFDTLNTSKSTFENVLKMCGTSVGYLKEPYSLRIIKNLKFGELETQKVVDIEKKIFQKIRDYNVLKNGHIVVAYDEQHGKGVKSYLEIYNEIGEVITSYSVNNKQIKKMSVSPDGYYVVALLVTNDKKNKKAFLHLYSLNKLQITQVSTMPMEPFPSMVYGATIQFNTIGENYYLLSVVSKKGKKGKKEKPDMLTLSIQGDELQLIGNDFGEYSKWLENMVQLEYVEDQGDKTKLHFVGVGKKNLVCLDYELMV